MNRQVARGPLLAPLLVIVIAFMMQSGSALATKVIGAVGVVDANWLRTTTAALVLIAVRPRSLRLPPPGQRRTVGLLALSLLCMNLSFYGAISLAPIGIVVAIEFSGPLVVAVLGSRRPADFVWVGLAAVGIAVLVGPSGSIGPGGLALALSAALFWGLYLVLARRALGVLEPLQVTTLIFAGSALMLTPVALLFAPRLVHHRRRWRWGRSSASCRRRRPTSSSSSPCAWCGPRPTACCSAWSRRSPLSPAFCSSARR